jgi:hypothetical protein
LVELNISKIQILSVQWSLRFLQPQVEICLLNGGFGDKTN